jgi:hypothetical protein
MAAPLWRRAFDRVERGLGKPLESGVATPEFATLLGVVTCARRDTGQAIDRAFAWWLHQWGMPASRDVRDVARSVTGVERRLRELSQQVELLVEAAAEREESTPQ